VLTATVTYVGVTIGEHRPIPPPDEVRAHLSA
jgi:acyl-CoA thioesterase FadM